MIQSMIYVHSSSFTYTLSVGLYCISCQVFLKYFMRAHPFSSSENDERGLKVYLIRKYRVGKLKKNLMLVRIV